MSILIKPIITEKATYESETFNRYSFFVDVKANKIQIKDAIESVYGVSVEKVRTINYLPKLKSKNTKSGVILGKTNRKKKAIVELKDGEEIDLFNNI